MIFLDNNDVISSKTNQRQTTTLSVITPLDTTTLMTLSETTKFETTTMKQPDDQSRFEFKFDDTRLSS
jgi:hypothetical protein